MGRISDLFEKHQFMRRAGVIWSWCLITWVVYVVFSDVSLITTAVVSALGIVVGLLATSIGFYQWQRSRDDRQ